MGYSRTLPLYISAIYTTIYLSKIHEVSPTNYVGVRIYQGIRMIKRSEMRPLSGATFWDNHLPAVTTILTLILVCLKPKILPFRWCHFL